MQRFPFHLWLGLLLLAAAPAAPAVMSGDSPPPQVNAADPDYHAGINAWKNADWQGVIESMSRVIERRPWNDDAHNLLGFAYRKLGNYPRALEHYGTALELNPHHRGALEYLGETLLELNRPAEAEALLERLAVECRRLAAEPAADNGLKNCPEWQDLKAAIEAYRSARKAP